MKDLMRQESLISASDHSNVNHSSKNFNDQIMDISALTDLLHEDDASAIVRQQIFKLHRRIKRLEAHDADKAHQLTSLQNQFDLHQKITYGVLLGLGTVVVLQ